MNLLLPERHLLSCIFVSALFFSDVCLAQNITLSCEVSTNMRSVNSQKEVLSDQWWSSQIIFSLEGETYYVSNRSDGFTTSSIGTFKTTPSLYIFEAAAEQPSWVVSSELYIDRITGLYHEQTLMDDGLVITAIWGSGSCHAREPMVPKF